MPDRSLRLPLPAGSILLREGRPTPPPPQDAPPESAEPSRSSAKSRKSRARSSQDDNPFAPPPEGSPDRPWQPRSPESGQDDDNGDSSNGGQSPWGQWSDRQPGRAQGGGRFGDRPGQHGGQSGPEGPQGPGPGMRWDPSDPAQRHARYALLCGMWGFFFALFSWPYVALLLGALALYWGIVALRAKPRTPDPDKPAPAAAPGPKPQTTAAVSGLVTGSLALALVAAMFTAQFVYSDYFTCVNDALTNTSRQACDKKLPKELRVLIGARS
ncbi:hypothetical protein [Streptomyces sp. NPDC046821]|uniref:hypothetical protein n=1 Tax=Streptomyces sp. NPDC046821 TaxID=3154702 RepID=UPI0033D50C50